MRQCIAGLPLFRQRPPPRQDSLSPKPGRPAHCTSSTAHRPQAVWRYIVGVAPPPALGSEAVYCRSCTAHCPEALWQCIAGVPLFRRRLPSGQDSPSPELGRPSHCNCSTAHRPQAVWHCIVGVALPTAPRHCGSALQEFRSLGSDRLLGRTPRPPSWWALALQEFHCPPPPGRVAVHCTSSTAHSPQAVRLCIAGVALPTAPEQCGSA